MDDQTILAHVKTLVDSEHALRQKAQQGEVSTDEEREQLRDLEESLDQCWDLLRQRRARREFDQDPDAARARPTSEVESYLQ